MSHTHRHSCSHTYSYTHTFMHPDTHTNTHSCMHWCTHTNTHAQTPPPIPSSTHTHTHTHTHTLLRPNRHCNFQHKQQTKRGGRWVEGRKKLAFSKKSWMRCCLLSTPVSSLCLSMAASSCVSWSSSMHSAAFLSAPVRVELIRSSSSRRHSANTRLPKSAHSAYVGGFSLRPRHKKSDFSAIWWVPGS